MAIEEDNGLSENLSDLLSTQKETAQLNAELRRIKGAYDTSLLEKIAAQKTVKAEAESLRDKISEQTAALNKLVQQRSLLESSLMQDKRIRDFFSLIKNLSTTDKNSLRSDLRKMNFWFPVKRMGMEMIFLLPLFVIFYLWSARSISANRPFQTLVSSHLLVVSFIPVFFKILELIYDIIPKKLLKHVIELLESLKLVALWHYLFMGITILVALAVIYLLQKKIFSREKLMEKRISRELCQNCARRLPSNVSACPFCGFEQFKLCNHCNKPTYVYGKFCKECGHGE